MECLFCGYCNTEKLNTYGTFCPKCGEHISPVQKSPLVKSLEEKKNQEKNMIRDLLRKKIEGVPNAHRD